MSQMGRFTRWTPRWSVACEQRPRSNARLVVGIARVKVGPPLFASAPSFGSMFRMSFVVTEKFAQFPGARTRFQPADTTVPVSWAQSSVVELARMLFITVNMPW